MNDMLISCNHSSSNIMFGGKVVVFGGDFRQILPVVQNGSKHDIVNASFCSSYICSNVKVLRLTKNMRLSLGIDSTNIKETTAFSNWLLDIEKGKVGEANDGESTIDIPKDLLIGDSSDPIIDLINFVYHSILDRFHEPNYFDNRAILAPTHEVVQSINDRLMSLYPGDEKEYLSLDSICESDYVNETLDEKLYSPDVLNGLKLSGVPNHQLVLKVGVPIMLLRNIDQKNGFCNDTRLRVLYIGNRVIEAGIISGADIGTRSLIPRLSLSPSNKKIPFKFKRRQFPVAICFAMTFNKSQGQSLSKLGLYLKDFVSHMVNFMWHYKGLKVEPVKDAGNT